MDTSILDEIVQVFFHVVQLTWKSRKYARNAENWDFPRYMYAFPSPSNHIATNIHQNLNDRDDGNSAEERH